MREPRINANINIATWFEFWECNRQWPLYVFGLEIFRLVCANWISAPAGRDNVSFLVVSAFFLCLRAITRGIIAIMFYRWLGHNFDFDKIKTTKLLTIFIQYVLFHLSAMATQAEALSVDSSNSSCSHSSSSSSFSSSSSTTIRFLCHGFKLYATQEWKHGKLRSSHLVHPDPIDITPIEIDIDSSSDSSSTISISSDTGDDLSYVTVWLISPRFAAVASSSSRCSNSLLLFFSFFFSPFQQLPRRFQIYGFGCCDRRFVLCWILVSFTCQSRSNDIASSLLRVRAVCCRYCTITVAAVLIPFFSPYSSCYPSSSDCASVEWQVPLIVTALV